ncbi:hypothetical protein BT69DRAFT_1359261 [Atractiella rhizophila]|nr:hypothetical protein BT69DRAFT_1359261 [Atractiella rhizophila]
MDYYLRYLKMIGTILPPYALILIHPDAYSDVCAALGGALYYGQDSLIYPASIPEGSRTEVPTPADLDLPYEEIWLTTPDKVKLHSYFILQGGRTTGEREMDANRVARNYPTVLFFVSGATFELSASLFVLLLGLSCEIVSALHLMLPLGYGVPAHDSSCGVVQR